MTVRTSDAAVERASAVFEKISTFDFGKVVDKYAKEHTVSSDTASEILLELKRWLALCMLHPENAYATGGKVDAMWHTFILFTKDYARFCDDIAGVFIHHSPEMVSDDVEERIRSAQNMLDKLSMLEADYSKYFGVLPPSHIWPRSPKANALQNAFLFLEAMSASRVRA